jgi:hypothetical protein
MILDIYDIIIPETRMILDIYDIIISETRMILDIYVFIIIFLKQYEIMERKFKQ